MSRYHGWFLAGLLVLTMSSALCEEAKAVQPVLAVIVRGGRGNYGTYTQNALDALKEAGLAYGVLSQQEVTAEALAGYKVALVPWNPDSAQLDKALEGFVRAGGKLVVCFSTSPAIRQLLGLESLTFTKPAYPGQFAFIKVDDPALPGAPAKTKFNSWNIFAPKPGPDVKVAGTWVDDAGRDTGIPALLISPAGCYLGHVLTAADPKAQQQLLLAAIGQLAPEAWQEAVEGKVARDLHLAEFATPDELQTYLEAQPECPRMQEALAYLQLAHEKFTKATRHLKRRFFPEADTALGKARDALSEAYVRAHPPVSPEIRGVWLVPDEHTDWDAEMRNLAEHGFNCVFPRMARGGNAIYKSEILPEDEWAKKKGDQLRACIKAAHKYGIQVHAWRVNFHLGSAPKWYYNKLAAEDRLVRDAQGRQSYTWACPSEKRNRRVEIAAMVEMVRNYDVDGIHFDYIRYPNSAYCYCDNCRRNFQRETGIHVAHWPDDVVNGPYEHAYNQWQRDNISSLVKAVYERTKAIKPWVQVSAAVFPRSEYSRYTIKQDWPKWAHAGYVDFVCPMDYTADDARLKQFAKRDIELARGDVPVAIGIGSYRHSQVTQTVYQLELARQAGADGFVLFSYSGWLPTLGVAGLSKGMLSKPAAMPFPAPKVYWRTPEGEFANYPQYYAAGQQLALKFTLDITQACSHEPVESVSGLHVRLVNLANPDVAPEEIPLTYASSKAGEFALQLPEGRCQPVLSGTLKLKSGREVGFERRGPVLVGLGEAELAEWRAREHPPEIKTNKIKVGIFEPGIGSSGILETLQGSETYYPFYLYQLSAEELAVADVAIVPQVSNVGLLGPRVLHRLREWVKAGGRVMLTHDAVGFRVHLTPFPEIGCADERCTDEPCRLGNPQKLGLSTSLEPGKSYAPSYSDYLALKAASSRAVAVLRGSEGRPAVLAAPFGKGKVVLNGLIPGYVAGREVPVEGWEKQLLKDLLQWLAAKPAEETADGI